MNKEQHIAAAVSAFEEKHHEMTIFMNGISQWFSSHPKLSHAKLAPIHSVKSRIKSPSSLAGKLTRKWRDDAPITQINIFEKVTDLAGVRVLHLHQKQFTPIHNEILTKVDDHKDWHLAEAPKAYTWDPESQKFFEEHKIAVHLKESFYTSVHYVVRPRPDSPLCCEIQVRTLFEEIWGEVDHSLNYPNPTQIVPCREQLKVLAKVVGAGSRLVDSIFLSTESPTENNQRDPH